MQTLRFKPSHPMLGMLLGLALSWLAAAPATAEERTFEKSFTVAPGGALLIDTATGAIDVKGTNGDQVIVRARLRGTPAPLERFRITADATSTGVEVHGKREGGNWFPLNWVFGDYLDVEYTIEVPRTYQVQARTSGDSLEVSNVTGHANLRTSGGNVRLSEFNGDAEVRTSGGDIHALRVAGSTRLFTSGGDIHVNDARGEVDARTSGGDIDLRAIDGKLKAHTSGGDIDAHLNGDNRGVDVSTSGGDIVLRVPADFKATVNARTSGGDVDCNLPVVSTGKHKRSSLQGDINGGGPPLAARTSGGGIRIDPAKP